MEFMDYHFPLNFFFMLVLCCCHLADAGFFTSVLPTLKLPKFEIYVGVTVLVWKTLFVPKLQVGCAENEAPICETNGIILGVANGVDAEVPTDAKGVSVPKARFGGAAPNLFFTPDADRFFFWLLPDFFNSVLPMLKVPTEPGEKNWSALVSLCIDVVAAELCVAKGGDGVSMPK